MNVVIEVMYGHCYPKCGPENSPTGWCPSGDTKSYAMCYQELYYGGMQPLSDSSLDSSVQCALPPPDGTSCHFLFPTWTSSQFLSSWKFKIITIYF